MMAERVRDYKAFIKAAGTADGLEEGQFLAIVSTYDVDSYGDVVIPGAFADDIARWKAGDVLPIVWSHQWTDPFSHIGVGVDAEEVEGVGLKVLGQVLDMEDNKTAKQVHRLMTGRRINQFSFAFDLLESGWAKHDGDEVYELRKLHTHEVGPCLVGVNQETQLIDAKARQLVDAVRGGRELSSDAWKQLDDTMKSIREVIDLSRLSAGYRDGEGPTGSPSDSATEQPTEDAKAEQTSVRPRLAMVDALLLD